MNFLKCLPSTATWPK